MSGSLTIVTARDGAGFAFNATDPQAPDAEFHSLLVRDHGGGSRSSHRATGAPGRCAWARWEEREPPPFIWGWADDLPALWPPGITFAADRGLTERHLAWGGGPGAPALRQLSGYACYAAKYDPGPPFPSAHPP